MRITKDLDRSIAGRHVLMVENIVDTGMTLNYLLNSLRTRDPASLQVCALLDKPARRLADVRRDYVGFELPEEFVVGYGLESSRYAGIRLCHRCWRVLDAVSQQSAGRVAASR